MLFGGVGEGESGVFGCVREGGRRGVFFWWCEGGGWEVFLGGAREGGVFFDGVEEVGEGEGGGGWWCEGWMGCFLVGVFLMV